jgi:hypothetical protein
MDGAERQQNTRSLSRRPRGCNGAKGEKLNGRIDGGPCTDRRRPAPGMGPPRTGEAGVAYPTRRAPTARPACSR